MRKLILATGLAMGLLAMVTPRASAFQFHTLDFEGFANGTALTNQYAAQHATFEFYNFAGMSNGIIGATPAGISPRSGVNTVSLGGSAKILFDVDVFQWGAYFTMPTSLIDSRIDVVAFDAGGNQVAGSSILGYGSNNRYLNLESPTAGIRSLALYSKEYTYAPEQSWMDDMSYTTAGNAPGNPVPEPASLLLFGTGLVGAFAARKRLRK